MLLFFLTLYIINTFTVSFFGHRIIDNALEIKSRLEQLIRALLRKHEYVAFLVGRNGAFDQLVSSTIRRCKRESHSENSAHFWVLPYLTAEIRDNEESFQNYYEEIVVCIQQVSGGLWQTMKYVNNQAKPYINLHNKTEVTE